MMSKELPKLDATGRAIAALNAAGRSARIIEHLPEKYRGKLAALVSDTGVAVPDVRDKVITVLRECGQENKAEGLLDKE
jgi:hypothetical protein